MDTMHPMGAVTRAHVRTAGLAPRAGRRRTPRALALAFGAAVSLAALLLATTSAYAASWSDEQAMIDTPNRTTFVAAPAQGTLWDRQALIDRHLAYYQSRGVANTLVWGTRRSDYQPGGDARWAGCGPSGEIVFGVFCPDGQTMHWGRIDAALADTRITVLEFGGAFIALACGNFSERVSTVGPPTISGTKFEDLDGDGVRDAGEPGRGGWTIQLYNAGALVGSTVTGDDGAYRFVLDADVLAIRSADFELREVLRSGWEQSRTPGTVRVPFGSAGGDHGGNDFGNYRPATIDGVKYEDMDADSDRDSDDPLLADWTIGLEGPSGPRSDLTDAAGAYGFSGLRPGTYTIAEQLKSGWRYGTPSDGTHTITVRSGETKTAEFGNYRPATITGVKFDDHDVDRERDAGEPGLPDWTIGLSGGRSADASQTTLVDGTYRFDGLIPGTYTVTEMQQDGWRQSAPATGTHTVTVRSGDTAEANDFGNVCLGTADVRITDEVGGAPLDGVEVRIEEIAVPGALQNEPELPRTTIATPAFSDLLPGTYRVVAFLPAGVYTSDPDLTVVDGRLAVVKRITVLECEATLVPIEMFTTSTGKVTGGMKMEVPGGYATAGFVFMTRQGIAQGSLEYVDHATGLNLHSEAIEQIHVRDNEAWIGGQVQIGTQMYRFSLHLVDNGEPGSDDRFHLIVENGYEVGENETIVGGNDQIHPPEHT